MRETEDRKEDAAVKAAESARPLERLCSLEDPRVKALLGRLHGEASRQGLKIARLLVRESWDRILRRTISAREEADRLRDLYVPLSEKQGSLAYLTARAIGARRIVEFGTSFGVSTIYLAAAVRDNGGGTVVGTELEPAKVRAARANVEEAGLADQVEIREGDALETLRELADPLDMALLDGLKDLYLPVLELLTPHLRRGAVVLADNIFTYWGSLRRYVAHVQDPGNGFHSVTLFLKDGTEYSVRL